MSDGQLKSLIERILHLHTEEDEIKADRREVYAEAKAAGYDKTALGAAVSILRKREKDAEGFAERNAIVDLYLAAYSVPSHVHAHAHEGRTEKARRAQSELGDAAVPPPGAKALESEHVDRSASARPHSAEGEPAISYKAGDAGTGQAVCEREAALAANTGQPSEAGTGSDVRAVAPIIAKPKAAEIDLTIPAFLDRRIPKPDARQ